MLSVPKHLLLVVVLGAAALSFAGCEGCNPTPPDVDGGGEGEGEGEGEGDGGVSEADAGFAHVVDPIYPTDVNNPDNENRDADCDGISDEEELTVTYAGGLTTDPQEWDTDLDGLADGVEAGKTEPIEPLCLNTWRDEDPSSRSSPIAADTDADCIPDGAEDRNLNGRVDDGESDPTRVDSDADGILDGAEDANCNGLVDGTETAAGDADTDDDGINDNVEITVTGTDPRDPDSDGDGITDGNEDRNQNGIVDVGETDPNVADEDSDGDGIADATEVALGYDPDNADMDGDGLCDGPNAVSGVCVGGEDTDVDGQLDPGETDPGKPDSDCDGVGDAEERTRGTNPRVRDTDGDLVSDGVELGKTTGVAGACAGTDIAFDADPSTTTNPLAVDTDGDGLNDGIEDRDRNGAMGPANPTGVQETDATDADTDNDGICDGPGAVAGTCSSGEDLNRNGRLDGGETDPRIPNVDSDNDGLSDQQEGQLGTSPSNPDTDGDGLQDGAEVNTHSTDPLSIDTDCDGVPDGAEVTGLTDPLIRDSDLDGLTDGVETGRDCTVGVDTDATCGARCIPDANPATTTNPLDDDSDNDGVVDGAEDGNHNGAVDPGELDPGNNADVNPVIASACATPIDPTRLSQAASDVFLALAPDFTTANSAAVASGGNSVGLTAVDPNAHGTPGVTAGIVAFAVKKAPEGASAAAELAAIQARIAGNTLPIEQPFTTWDGFGAARGTYERTGTGNLPTDATTVVRRVLNDNAAVVSFPSAPTTGGPFKLGLVVVRRSANVTIVVGVLTTTSAFDTATSGYDFRHEDIGGGTALAQVGDAIGTQCDVFDSTATQPVDFIWVLDNSGSMGDELAAVNQATADMTTQLQNSTIDWRIAVVTTEFNWPHTGPTFDGNGVGTCAFSGVAGVNGAGSRVCACKFTTSAATFQSCVAAITGLGGSGAEGGYAPLQSALTEIFLPTAVADTGKIRTGARVVSIFITDAGDQSPASNAQTFRMPYGPSNDLAASVTFWSTFFNGGGGTTWDPNSTTELPMILAGILCPLTVDCNGEEDSTGTQALDYVPPPAAPQDQRASGNSVAIGRYYQVIQSPTSNGIIGAISGPDGDTLPDLTDIGTTITAILNGVIGEVAPYTLSQPPISSTLKVALAGPTIGACTLTDVPRSRQNGFSYDAQANTISFFGNCRPSSAGADVAVSYRTWIDLTNDPEGGDIPCDGLCPPELCVNDQCVCPSDCGVPGGLPSTQTCSAPPECAPTCLADCGGCGGGQVCDTNACACACPADCNGPKPGDTYVCDPGTCQWTCPADGCDIGDKPGDNWTCGNTCEWECPADCGGGLSATERCDPATCEATCASDCNATCGAFESCVQEGCACECSQTGVCAPGFVFDIGSCGCVCDTTALGCPVTHEADLDSCTCSCKVDAQGVSNCGGCDPSSICVPGNCTCIPIGG